MFYAILQFAHKSNLYLWMETCLLTESTQFTESVFQHWVKALSFCQTTALGQRIQDSVVSGANRKQTHTHAKTTIRNVSSGQTVMQPREVTKQFLIHLDSTLKTEILTHPN